MNTEFEQYIANSPNKPDLVLSDHLQYPFVTNQYMKNYVMYVQNQGTFTVEKEPNFLSDGRVQFHVRSNFNEPRIYTGYLKYIGLFIDAEKYELVKFFGNFQTVYEMFTTF